MRSGSYTGRAGTQPSSPPTGRPTRFGRGSGRGDGPQKGLWIVLAILALVIVAAVVVFAWYLPSRTSEIASTTTVASDSSPTTAASQATVDPESADLLAKSLMRSAMSALETAYLDMQTFSPEHVTAEMLTGIEPSVTFIPWPDTSAFSAATAEAVSNTVNYAGNETNYALGTVSASGNIFGIITNKEGEGNTEYYVNGQEQDWDAPLTSTTDTTAPTAPTGASGDTVLYQDYGLGCSFEYPVAWSGYSLAQLGVKSLGTGQSPLAVGDPADSIAQSTGNPTDFLVFFGAVATTPPSSSARAVIESLASSIESTYPTMTITQYEAIADFQVNGLPAASWAFRTQKQGETRTSVWKYVALCFNGDAFVFCFGSDETQWESNSALFAATLNSFQMTLMPPPLAP